MPLFSIDLSGEFQSFLIVEALSAAIGIGAMKLHSGRTFVSVLGYRVSRFSDGVFIGKICTVSVSSHTLSTRIDCSVFSLRRSKSSLMAIRAVTGTFI